MYRNILLHLVPKAAPTIGGLQHYVHELALEQIRQGFLPIIASLGEGASGRLDGVPYTSVDVMNQFLSVGRRGGRLSECVPFAIRRISSLIDRYHPALIHAHEAPVGAIAHTIAERAGIPLVTTLSNYTYLSEPAFPAFLAEMRWLEHRDTVLIAGSKTIASAHGLGSGNSVKILEPGVAFDRYQIDYRERLPKQQGRVFYPARIMFGQKRQHLAIEAVRSFEHWKRPVSLVCAGPVSHTRFHGAIEDDGRMNRLARSVSFLTWCEYPYEMMREAYSVSECTLLTSRDEGFGRTVIESILAGTPCIIAGSGGAAEWLSAIVPEWVVGEDDPRALASAIGRVFAHQSEARSRAFELHDQLFERFSMKMHSLRISEIYDSLLPRAN